MPRAEVLSIGTELLLGQVLDTNSQFIAIELAQLGIDCFFRTTVGDNKQRIKEALHQAFSRAEIVITTGGLGPTADDLTTECLAEFFGAELKMDEVELARIESFFKTRGYPMPMTNRKQALRPAGADVLPNPKGTAPGLIWRVKEEQLRFAALDSIEQERLVFTFPGVPSELKAMWAETAAPYLRGRYEAKTLWSKELKHYGIGESALAEQFAHLLELSNPTVAPYAGRNECRLRVTAKADTEDAARALAQPIIDEIVRQSGVRCYGFDSDTLESVVGELLAVRNLTIAVAESCTGGLVSKRLTEIAGSSRYVGLNVVAYSNEAKIQFLKVPKPTIEAYGAVSAECVKEMAENIRAIAHADIGLAISGLAGPGGGSDEKPVGLVHMGLAVSDFFAAKTIRLGSTLSRSEIRYRTANEALNMVRIYLLEGHLLRPTVTA